MHLQFVASLIKYNEKKNRNVRHGNCTKEMLDVFRVLNAYFPKQKSPPEISVENINFKLPPIKTAQEVDQAMDMILEALSNQGILIKEASLFVG
jgi:hypothetical protein